MIVDRFLFFSFWQLSLDLWRYERRNTKHTNVFEFSHDHQSWRSNSFDIYLVLLFALCSAHGSHAEPQGNGRTCLPQRTAPVPRTAPRITSTHLCVERIGKGFLDGPRSGSEAPRWCLKGPRSGSKGFGNCRRG